MAQSRILGAIAQPLHSGYNLFGCKSHLDPDVTTQYECSECMNAPMLHQTLAKPTKLLIFASNPIDEQRLRIEEEIRATQMRSIPICSRVHFMFTFMLRPD